MAPFRCLAAPHDLLFGSLGCDLAKWHHRSDSTLELIFHREKNSFDFYIGLEFVLNSGGLLQDCLNGRSIC